MTKKIFSSGIIFLGYKSNFQKSGGHMPPRFLRHCKRQILISDVASGVRKSKHALPCAQHTASMTISSTERRYGIIEPWEYYHISLMMDSNFEASSGYLPINLWNVLISFLAKKNLG